MSDLIVMRLADMARVHPRQDDSRVCSKCSERVGIYPSGQAALRRYPDLAIVCSHCAGHYDVKVLARNLAPGAENEPFESVPVIEGKVVE